MFGHHLYSEIVSQMEPALKHLPEDWAGWYERRLTTHTFSDKTKETKQSHGKQSSHAQNNRPEKPTAQKTS